MIWFIFDLGIGLTTFVALVVAFFKEPEACGLAAGLGARPKPFPAHSLPDPAAREMSSLPAAPSI
jgi:hypothetical protein